MKTVRAAVFAVFLITALGIVLLFPLPRAVIITDALLITALCAFLLILYFKAEWK